MIRLPINNRRWTITNSGEVFGDMYGTRNVHFDDEGYATLSPKSVSIYSNTDDSDFDLPVAIEYFNNKYYIVTSDGVFSLTSALTFAEIASSPSTTAGSDAVVWQNRLYVSSDTNLSYLNTSDSWTNSLKSTTTDKAHPMAVMDNFSGGYLAIGNANTVILMNTSHTTVATLTLNADYEVTTLRYRQGYLYVGTKRVNGGEAQMFLWNGSGAVAQSSYGVKSNRIFALEDYQSSVCAITNAGQILRFNGGGFDVLANFPVYYTEYSWDSALGIVGKVLNRGMKADGDVLYINMNGMVARELTVNSVGNSVSFFLENQPSGVWCYDPQVGLYNRNLSTTDTLSTVSVSSMSANILTLASSQNLETGEPIHIKAVGSLTGVSANTTYYAIKVTSTTYKLAVSPADAKAGTVITLGGSAGSATVQVIGYTNFGESFSLGKDAGAIQLTQVDTGSPQIFPVIVKTPYIWGFQASDDTLYLNVLSQGRSVGSVTLNKVWSLEVEDAFSHMFVKHSNLNLDTDQIIARFRGKEIFGLPTIPVYATYSDASTIGCDSAYMGQVVAGNQITILNGNGAGYTANIKTVNGDEFVLDEAIPNVTSADAINIFVRDYKKSSSVTNTDAGYSRFNFDEKKTWIQTEVELRGNGVKIEEIQLINATHVKSQ